MYELAVGDHHRQARVHHPVEEDRGALDHLHHHPARLELLRAVRAATGARVRSVKTLRPWCAPVGATALPSTGARASAPSGAVGQVALLGIAHQQPLSLQKESKATARAGVRIRPADERVGDRTLRTLVTPSVLATMAVRIAPFMLMRWWI